MALATTAPMVMIAGSPPLDGGDSRFSISTVSILGSHEKRGSGTCRSYGPALLRP